MPKIKNLLTNNLESIMLKSCGPGVIINNIDFARVCCPPGPQINTKPSWRCRKASTGGFAVLWHARARIKPGQTNPGSVLRPFFAPGPYTAITKNIPCPIEFSYPKWESFLYGQGFPCTGCWASTVAAPHGSKFWRDSKSLTELNQRGRGNAFFKPSFALGLCF